MLLCVFYNEEKLVVAEKKMRIDRSDIIRCEAEGFII